MKLKIDLDDPRIKARGIRLPHEIHKLKKILAYCKDNYFTEDQRIEIKEEEVLGLLLAKYLQFNDDRLAQVIRHAFQITNFHSMQSDLKHLEKAVENTLNQGIKQ